MGIGAASQQVSQLSQYGVAGIILAIVMVGVFLLIGWLLRQWEKREARADLERAKWFEITAALKTSIDASNSTTLEHGRRSDEATLFVRQEHEKMCDSLAAQSESLKLLVQELKLRPCMTPKE